VLNDSIAYRRIPVGIHWGARRGWLRDGDLTQLHVDIGVKLWKIGLGYSRLWTDALLSEGTTKYDFEGTGNGLRLSFAPLPPISLDVMLGGGTGELRTESGPMMTTTPDASLSHRSFGLTLVPWGRGVWNIAVRFDIHTLAVDGASTWGPGVDIALTVL
jgi:hypothetical protein